MIFTNFYNQPLRQVLAEAIDIDSKNNAAHRTPIVSATSTEAAAPVKAMPAITASVTPTRMASIAPGKVVPITAAKAGPMAVVAVPATQVVRAKPAKACDFFLTRQGCKFGKNCRFSHDHAAFAKLKEQWTAGNAKKLEQVRFDQQIAYSKKALAVKSNNLAVNSTVESAIMVSTAVAPSSKTLPKAAESKRLCKQYLSPWGCLKKHCLFLHEDTSKPSRPPKPVLVNISEPKEVPPAPKPIVWKGNPNLLNEEYCCKAIWQIFGVPQPSKKQAKEWCKEMSLHGNFKNFNANQLGAWVRQLGMTSDECAAWIMALPGNFERLTPLSQIEVRKIKDKLDAEEARPTYDIFHCFSKLPCEIRLQIWGYAAQHGRMVKVALNQGTIYPDNGPGLFKRTSPPSPLWMVNKEAKKMAMEDESCNYYFGVDYFSPKIDILHFKNDEDTLHRFASEILNWGGEVVTRFSIPWYRFDKTTCMKTLAGDILKAFPCVQYIELQLSDSDFHKKDRPSAPRVTEKAKLAIHTACKGRVGLPLPDVRLVMMAEAEAVNCGVDSKW